MKEDDIIVCKGCLRPITQGSISLFRERLCSDCSSWLELAYETIEKEVN